MKRVLDSGLLEHRPRASTRLLGVVPWLACAVIVWLLTGLTRDEWLGFGACLLVASLVYLATRGRAMHAAARTSRR